MSEIIPKEKILKNVRRGLLFPSVAPFSNLDFDSEIYNDTRVKNEESIIQTFLSNENAYFQACGNKYEFLMLFKKLMDIKGWKEPVCHETSITELLNDNGIKTQVNMPMDNSPIITTCIKALSKPSVFIFDNRFQLVRKILSAPIIVLVLTESQLKPYYKDKSYFQLNPLDNHSRMSIFPKDLINKEVYIFTLSDNI